MKKLLIALAALSSATVFAHEIQGTLILKGSLKTKIVVNNVKTECRVKIEKVKNLREEDAYGNPGYTVKTNIALEGSDSKTSTKVKYSKTQQFINMLEVNGLKKVSDFDYVGEDGSTMKIDSQGRIKNVAFTFENKKITCSF